MRLQCLQGLLFPTRAGPRPRIGDIDPCGINNFSFLDPFPFLKFAYYARALCGKFGCLRPLALSIRLFDVDADAITRLTRRPGKERGIHVAVETDSMKTSAR